MSPAADLARTRAAGLAAVALALLVAAPLPATLQRAHADRTRLFEGTLELLVAEDPEAAEGEAMPVYEYALRTPTGRLELRIDGELPDGFVNGASVRVAGTRDGNLVALDGHATSNVVLASAPGAGTGVKRLAVVLINFTNNASRPFTRSFANGVVFGTGRSARGYFAEESKGAVRLEGTTFDWIRVPYSNASCQPQQWADAARSILTSRGTDLRSYTNFMFMFPSTSSCKWRGLGYLPGRDTWENGTPALRTTVHELSHNFGAHHASSLRCTSNGVRVALSSRCTRSEYGDPFTTMGAASTRHSHSLALVQLGYVGLASTRTVTTSGTYTLAPALGPSGTRVIRIPRGNGTWFYLEYRRPSGTYFDNFPSTSYAVRGVTIRISGDWNRITQSQLIDTVPSTTTFSDAPLRAGRSFRDYLSRVVITTRSISASGAQVSISLPADTQAPGPAGSFTATAPDTSVVRLAWSAAADDREVGVYRIWRDGVLLGSVAADTVGVSDHGVLPGTSYEYTIRAVDLAGNVGAARAASVAVPAVEPASTDQLGG